MPRVVLDKFLQRNAFALIFVHLPIHVRKPAQTGAHTKIINCGAIRVFPLIIRSRYGSLGSKKENDVRTSCAVKQQVKKKRCHEKQLTSNENLPLAESGLGDTNAEQDWDFGEAP